MQLSVIQGETQEEKSRENRRRGSEFDLSSESVSPLEDFFFFHKAIFESEFREIIIMNQGSRAFLSAHKKPA